MRSLIGTVCLLLAAPPGGLITEVDVPAVKAQLAVEPDEVTVGDRIVATLSIDLPAGFELERREIGPELGPFEVSSGRWSGPTASDDTVRWIWTGQLAAFRTGSVEIPSIGLRARDEAKEIEFSTEPVAVEIRSLLAEEEDAEGEPEISDLKPPASMPARYRALWFALGALVLLLGLSGVLWWLQRRYGSRLAAAEVPDDPFRRVPPHVWVYKELQKLLDRRLEERGESGVFFSELSWILKRYLGGRYRVDLVEHTTEESPPILRQAGAPETAIADVRSLLAECDLVKFAGRRPRPPEWREAVDAVYRIVDKTKPVTAAAASQADRGAA